MSHYTGENMQDLSGATVALYVVKSADGRYFAGFDSARGRASFVDDAILAKKFTNKHDIKLRPEETLVELSIDLSQVAVKISDPFRPARRLPRTR